jgi:hypothetical protein
MVNVELIAAGFFAIALGLVWGAYLVLEQKKDRLAVEPFSTKAGKVSQLPFAFMALGIAFIVLGWVAS